jgi:hypothetical protein
MSSIVPFESLEARPLANELSVEELLPQHRFVAYCERERTVFDVMADHRNDRKAVKRIAGICGAPGAIGGVLALADALVIHSHGLMGAAEGGMDVTALAAVLLACAMPEFLDDRKVRRQATELDAPRAAREQAGEYARGSQHVQWAPRVLARKGKVIVQQCRFMMINGSEAGRVKGWSMSRRDRERYAIEPVWEQEFDPEDTVEVAELVNELRAEAAELERASWSAYMEKREEVLAHREREQLAQVAARGTALALAAA